MPDLIYNVKFEIDKASAEKVGQIVDTSNSEDIKVLQKEVERLNNVLKESRVENGKVNKSVKEKILAYKEEVASLKLLDSKINKSIQVYGEFSDETMSLVSDLRMQSQAVDNTGQELLGLANASDRTTGEVIALTNAVSTGNRAMVTSAKRAREFTSAQSIMEGQMGEGIKTFSAGNQAIFSFSDLIQDSTQFSYGFATGMRAIGNNISFTAELLAYLSKEAKASGQTLRQSLLASLKGVNGVVLALNFAVTVGTILLEKFGKKSKETADDLDEANEAGDRFLQTTDALIEALEKVNILTSPEAAKKRRLAELDIEITRLQTIEHQNVQQEKALRIALDTLKNSRIAERIRFQEGVSLEQRNAFALAQFSIQQEIDKLDIGKKERAEEISALQKEQMELGTQIRIETQQTAKAEAEALDILTKRREEGQAQVDLLRQGRDLERPSLLGDVPELDLNQARIDANKAMFDAMFKDADAYAQAQKALNTDVANIQINTRRMVLSTLSSLAGAFAQENKGIAYALLAIEKGLAIADVIITGKKEAFDATAKGINLSANPLTAALGASYFAAAGAIKANTIATVAAIAAQGIGQASSISRAGGGSGSRGGGGASASSQAAGGSGIISTGTATQMDRNIGFLPARGGEFSGAEITIVNTFDEEKVSEVADRGARKRQQQQVVVA
jgi:hypothetical protein